MTKKEQHIEDMQRYHEQITDAIEVATSILDRTAELNEGMPMKMIKLKEFSHMLVPEDVRQKYSERPNHEGIGMVMMRLMMDIRFLANAICYMVAVMENGGERVDFPKYKDRTANKKIFKSVHNA